MSVPYRVKQTIYRLKHRVQMKNKRRGNRNKPRNVPYWITAWSLCVWTHSYLTMTSSGVVLATPFLHPACDAIDVTEVDRVLSRCGSLLIICDATTTTSKYCTPTDPGYISYYFIVCWLLPYIRPLNTGIAAVFVRLKTNNSQNGVLDRENTFNFRRDLKWINITLP